MNKPLNIFLFCSAVLSAMILFAPPLSAGTGARLNADQAAEEMAREFYHQLYNICADKIYSGALISPDNCLDKTVGKMFTDKVFSELNRLGLTMQTGTDGNGERSLGVIWHVLEREQKGEEAALDISMQFQVGFNPLDPNDRRTFTGNKTFIIPSPALKQYQKQGGCRDEVPPREEMEAIRRENQTAIARLEKSLSELKQDHSAPLMTELKNLKYEIARLKREQKATDASPLIIRDHIGALDEFQAAFELLNRIGCQKGAELDKAIALSRRVTGRNPFYADAHYNLAIALECRGDRSNAAEKSYLNALTSDPAFKEAHNNLGNLYKDKKEYQKAERHLKEAERLDPGSWQPRYNLACLYAVWGKKEPALAELKQAFVLGFKDKDLLSKDEDFKSLREDKAFKEIIK